jgi:NitT/TauT family transport system substrate-binding protein
MKFRARHLSAAVGVGLLALLTGCGGSGSTAAADTQSGSSGGSGGTPEVTFATSANPSSIGLLMSVIKDQHLDTKHGITLVAKTYTPDNAETALLTGQVDAGFFGYVSWAKSPQKQQHVDLLGPLQAEHGQLLVPPSSPAKSLADLKGKKIASLGPVSGNYTDFAMLAAKMGMNWQSDFKHVSAPPPALISFLKSGKVDASILYEPNATKLTSDQSAREIISGNDKWKSLTGSPLYMLAVAANADFVSAHPGEAKDVEAAVADGVHVLATDPSVYSTYKDILKLSGDNQVNALAKEMSAIYTDQSPEDAEPAVEQQLKLAAQLHIIPSAPDHVFTTAGQ